MLVSQKKIVGSKFSGFQEKCFSFKEKFSGLRIYVYRIKPRPVQYSDDYCIIETCDTGQSIKSWAEMLYRRLHVLSVCSPDLGLRRWVWWRVRVGCKIPAWRSWGRAASEQEMLEDSWRQPLYDQTRKKIVTLKRLPRNFLKIWFIETNEINEVPNGKFQNETNTNKSGDLNNKLVIW